MFLPLTALVSLALLWSSISGFQLVPASSDDYKPSGYNPSDKKIAFLFLSKGAMPLEDIWHEFFRWRADPKHYSIYIYRPNNVPHDRDSLFYGRDVPTPVHVTWGNSTIAIAIRQLMSQALKDPLNEWFCTISESCVPTKPFNKFRNDLLSQEKSIINACSSMGSISRYHPSLKTVGIFEDSFRKSETWVAVRRKHAEVFAYRTAHMDNAFYNVHSGAEHFLPTVLAFYKLENETTCSTNYVFANWAEGANSHPKTYHWHYFDDENGYLFKSMARKPCQYYIARKFGADSKTKVLERLSWFLSEDDVPYTGNPWDVVNSKLRYNSTSGQIRYFIIDNGIISEIPIDEQVITSYHFNLSMAKPLSEEASQVYQHGSMITVPVRMRLRHR